MMVANFLQWAEDAPTDKRIEAADALARAYLQSDLSTTGRQQVMTGLFGLVDDPSLEVRLRLADVFADDDDAPRAIIYRLLDDDPRVAACLYARSPLVGDPALKDGLARGDSLLDVAIASRLELSTHLVDHIMRSGSVDACSALLANPYCHLPEKELARFLNRFGADLEALSVLETYRRVPAHLQVRLVASRAGVLSANSLVQASVTPARLERLTSTAKQRAVMQLLRDLGAPHYTQVVEGIIAESLMTPAFVLRVALSGNVDLLEHIISALSHVDVERVRAAFLHTRPAAAASLMKKCGLSNDVRIVLSMTCVLARELAKADVSWTDESFSACLIEVIDEHDRGPRLDAQAVLSAETVEHCHVIVSEIHQDAARDRVALLNAPRHTVDVESLIESEAVKLLPTVETGAGDFSDTSDEPAAHLAA